MFVTGYYFALCRCIDMDAYLKSPISTSLVVAAAVFEGLATFIVALLSSTPKAGGNVRESEV